jgi:hypothetical protein
LLKFISTFSSAGPKLNQHFLFVSFPDATTFLNFGKINRSLLTAVANAAIQSQSADFHFSVSSPDIVVGGCCRYVPPFEASQLLWMNFKHCRSFNEI